MQTNLHVEKTYKEGPPKSIVQCFTMAYYREHEDGVRISTSGCALLAMTEKAWQPRRLPRYCRHCETSAAHWSRQSVLSS